MEELPYAFRNPIDYFIGDQPRRVILLYIFNTDAFVYFLDIYLKLVMLYKISSKIAYFIINESFIYFQARSDLLDLLPENITAVLNDFFRKHVADVKQDLLVKVLSYLNKSIIE